MGNFDKLDGRVPARFDRKQRWIIEKSGAYQNILDFGDRLSAQIDAINLQNLIALLQQTGLLRDAATDDARHHSAVAVALDGGTEGTILMLFHQPHDAQISGLGTCVQARFLQT